MTKGLFLAYVATAASALVVFNVAVAPAISVCDFDADHCKYNAFGRLTYPFAGSRAATSDSKPAATRHARRTVQVSVQVRTVQYSLPDIALKSGESAELSNVWFVTRNDCKSVLKSTPEVQILDGPPGVTATVNAAEVMPRGLGCTRPVSGGKLVITANDIQEYSHTEVTLRINYKTLDGDRQRGETFNITLFPSH